MLVSHNTTDSPSHSTLTHHKFLTVSLVYYSYSHENLSFFVPFLPDTPFMGASDIGQESALFSTPRY